MGRDGRQYERLGEAAEAGGHNVTAARSRGCPTALCWHFGKFVFVQDIAQLKAASDRTAACYATGAWALEPAA